jgi:16S rRNA (guanine(966)-N(2))-methyltransferase RsmD
MSRIISGTAKNINLSVPKKGTRPITDRAKSALFSILSNITLNSIVLDLFAGSGSLGIEALSRGAKFAVFVDSADESVKCISENLQKAKLSNKAEVINSDAKNYVLFSKRNFDLIFIDSPYSDTNTDIINLASECLKKDGIIVVKHSPTYKTPDEINTLLKVDHRKYGKNAISFYK